MDNAIDALNEAERLAKEARTGHDSRLHIRAARLMVESQALILREHRR